jgi:hypothetical protein
MAVCVAIIDEHVSVIARATPNTIQTPPLLVCATHVVGDARHALQLLMHTSLDIIDEKLNVQTTDIREMYLGQLLANDAYRT